MNDYSGDFFFESKKFRELKDNCVTKPICI